jgi:hypothetical protein
VRRRSWREWAWLNKFDPRTHDFPWVNPGLDQLGPPPPTRMNEVPFHPARWHVVIPILLLLIAGVAGFALSYVWGSR